MSEWQTSKIQILVWVTTCGFKSHFPHITKMQKPLIYKGFCIFLFSEIVKRSINYLLINTPSYFDSTIILLPILQPCLANPNSETIMVFLMSEVLILLLFWWSVPPVINLPLRFRYLQSSYQQ